MKLHEVKDPIKGILDRMSKDYAPGGALAPTPRKSPEEIEMAKMKHDQHLADRANVEAALEPLAKKYAGNELQKFKKEAEATLPPEQLKGVDLNSMFNLLNPERKKQSEQSWMTFAQHRAADKSGWDD